MTETELELNKPLEQVKLNDNVIRLIGIPLFGIFIPNLTGLFGNLPLSDIRYWVGYVYFIVLAALIWQGNRYLLFRTRQRFTWFDKPIEKLILLFINNIFYTTPLTVAWLCLWYNFAGFSAVKWNIILVVALINVIAVLFVTHVYETVFMVREQEGAQIKNAELQRARAEAELAALKNQIDPHFIFNSLNTLTHLIKLDSHKALEFTENLAEVYRYILSQKDQTLVLLDDELEFTNKYVDLLHLRFGNALIIQKQFNAIVMRKFLVPPMSVFVAFENVVKHNEISEKEPMYINIDIQHEQLIVRNIVRERKNHVNASHIGLKNLNERFKLITNKCIIAKREEGRFVVCLPLISINS